MITIELKMRKKLEISTAKKYLKFLKETLIEIGDEKKCISFSHHLANSNVIEIKSVKNNIGVRRMNMKGANTWLNYNHRRWKTKINEIWFDVNNSFYWYENEF